MNKALLRRVAQKLRRLRHEEHYDQHTWMAKTACGTAACIAGHVVAMAGWKPVFDWGPTESLSCRKGKQQEEIPELAAKLLGIDGLTQERLFGGAEEWPEEYSTRWFSWRERHSRIAADLLDDLADGSVKL